jgi:hypothetical protein
MPKSDSVVTNALKATTARGASLHVATKEKQKHKHKKHKHTKQKIKKHEEKNIHSYGQTSCLLVSMINPKPKQLA